MTAPDPIRARLAELAVLHEAWMADAFHNRNPWIDAGPRLLAAVRAVADLADALDTGTTVGLIRSQVVDDIREALTALTALGEPR